MFQWLPLLRNFLAESNRLTGVLLGSLLCKVHIVMFVLFCCPATLMFSTVLLPCYTETKDFFD